MQFFIPLTSLVTSAFAVDPCLVTTYSQIASAVANCINITLQGLHCPDSSSLNLSKLLPNSVVTFSGDTTFGFTNRSSFDSIVFGGKNVTITATDDAVIDGNGQAYWDGLGSNGGLPKPNDFIIVKMTNGSTISNLRIQNWPSHLFSIGGSSDLTIRDLFLDNRAGDIPNNRSGTLPAAHNSDGLDISSSHNILVSNITIYNQDDCVAITSGNNITVSDMQCSGSHGLSIGSIGGKSNNNVTNILFTNSTLASSANGARIKSNFNTTGFIANITYSNIFLSNISTYGIDIQQDYLNGGATGVPSNGVLIQNILFENVTGTVNSGARGIYVLCGVGSCADVVFDRVNITGSVKGNSCNFPTEGCPD